MMASRKGDPDIGGMRDVVTIVAHAFIQEQRCPGVYQKMLIREKKRVLSPLDFLNRLLGEIQSRR